MKSSTNDLIIFKNDNYESRNSDNNILKFNSKNIDINPNKDNNKIFTKK